MKYLTIFLSTTLATAIVYFTLALALSPAPIAAEYWVREMIVIKRSIAQQYAGQRKVIIAAGSNALFSIDTKQLSNELQLPVVNFGLHGSLRLKTVLGEAEAAAETGDTVILPLEQNYYCIKEPTDWQVRNIIAWDRGEWANLSIVEHIKAISMFDATFIFELSEAKLRERFMSTTIDDRLTALDDLAILTKFATAPEPATFAYSAFNLDSLGNMKNANGAEYSGIPRSADKKTAICSESWQLLSSFTANMSRKGVGVYFANIPYVATDRLNMEDVKIASDQFVRELSRFAPVLDRRPNLVFPRKLFFNTDLHMNADGRRLRTQMLADSIAKNTHLLVHIQSE